MKKIEEIRPSILGQVVEEQIEQLENYLRKIEHQVEDNGVNVRIIENKGTEQYYIISHKDKKAHYIPKKDITKVEKVAQENYYKKIIPKVKQEIAFLKKTLEDFQKVDIFNYYKNINEKRKKFITPPTLPDEEYVKKWLEIKYFGKKFTANNERYITSWGLKVRSKSEIIIAEILRTNKIPFRYEYPITMDGYTVYPDFYCLNVRTRKEYIWEHLGKLDDAEYIENNMKKFEAYNKHNIIIGEKLIITYETRNYPLTKKMIDTQIETFLK